MKIKSCAGLILFLSTLVTQGISLRPADLQRNTYTADGFRPIKSQKQLIPQQTPTEVGLTQMIEPRRKPDNITYLLEALLDARTRGKKFVEIWIKKVEAYLADEVADLTQKGQNLNLEMERAMTGKVDQVLSINDTLQQMGILIKDMNISQVISCPALEKIRTQTKNVVDSARECVSNSTNSGIAKIKELVDKVKELHNEPDKITDQNCTHDIFGAPKPSGRIVGCIKDQLQNLINSIVIVLTLKKCSVETFKATINRLQEGIVQIGSCVTKYARDKLLGKIGF